MTPFNLVIDTDSLPRSAISKKTSSWLPTSATTEGGSDLRRREFMRGYNDVFDVRVLVDDYHLVGPVHTHINLQSSRFVKD
jgi:hypothetical protein